MGSGCCWCTLLAVAPELQSLALRIGTIRWAGILALLASLPNLRHLHLRNGGEDEDSYHADEKAGIIAVLRAFAHLHTFTITVPDAWLPELIAPPLQLQWRRMRRM